MEPANKELDEKRKDIEEKIQKNSIKEIELNKIRRSLEDKETQLNTYSGDLDKRKAELDNQAKYLEGVRDSLNADKAALATIPVPPAEGAVNTPAAAVVKLTEAFVKITFETDHVLVLTIGNTVSPVALTFTPW
jgi:peptidoglycan hydrolase CwlO-like protein